MYWSIYLGIMKKIILDVRNYIAITDTTLQQRYLYYVEYRVGT